MEVLDAKKVIENFEDMTSNAERIQEETLKKILEQNGPAEYLKKLGLNGRTDVESFKACVPVVTHQDLEPYIQRIADGDTSPILTGKPITTISLSSGTTQGRSKFVPFNDELFETTMETFQTSYAFRDREFPIKKGKALQFNYGSKQFKTKGGLIAGTATTHIFRNSQYMDGMKAMKSPSCSPIEVIYATDYHQSLYCHLLCGLIYCDEVRFVFSSFGHSIVRAFDTFIQVWQELCTDICKGILSDRVADPSIRESMSKLLKPNPELADMIYKKCSGLINWCGLIPELFPNAKYVYGVFTGSMEPYVKKLRNYAGWLPLVCGDYGASEGWIGVNVNPKLPPESATFVVPPNSGYFEFIPLEENRAHHGHLEPEPVGLTEVKVGEEYEVVFTNFAGLYRYRLGDVVKVMGFHNSTPELKFICRRNLILTVNIDKNTEKDLQLAVEEAARCLAAEKVDVVDFTSHVDLSTEPGHYVVFWELSSDVDESLLKECCNCLDRSFNDVGYVSSRKVGNIGPLELRVVQKGTFLKILEHYLGIGGTASQFKTPRYVGPSNKAVLQILFSYALKSYLSSAFG
ncbi:Jasmonoyl--L-amino acid synthetase jar6 [Ancistrocladus abbreviatus]